ncbi:hypothetical protein DXG03_009300 [Asterophora parasitica]|uniref:AAA+ ATPase domain-containing protein n=1 Tax=Asterophora parasitica TaxID=117018 RepID=A0A9P7KCA3_9AGAR|nr:hypothetical protein DXG03_009300 [Asterophora parasitica]
MYSFFVKSPPVLPSIPPPEESSIRQQATTEVKEDEPTNNVCLQEPTPPPSLPHLEPQPVHPFFAKQPPSLSPNPPPEPLDVHREEVIEIIDDDTTDSVSSQKPPPPPSLSQEGGSQEDPIVLDSSPLKPIRIRNTGTSKPLAPLFSNRLSKASSAPTPQSSKEKALDAPYPGRTSQHVRGPQQNFASPPLAFNRRAKYRTGNSEGTAQEIAEPLKRYLNDSHIYSLPINDISPSAAVDLSTDAPLEEQHHPAISRCTAQPHASTSAHRLWVDKWHPTRAAECLGNEANAEYLRDWIQALELHLRADAADETADSKGKAKAKTKADTRGTKRPRVVRAVEKRRGRKKRRVNSDDEDNWIVYSDVMDFEEPDNPDIYSEAARSSPPLHDASNSYMPSSPILTPTPAADLSQPPSSTPPVSRYTFDPLTNTMLLVGPSGSGKTAAVYACAEELGWDVFEVHPGIGRRNGPGIENLIGDVGKNHHVRKTRNGNASTSSESGGALAKLLKSNKQTAPIETATEDAHAPSADFGFVSQLPTDGADTAPAVRQSLILLEEVDILFKEDASFWPAVTNFIKECRRPVICTCNDISLVPTQDLPLQGVITFQPCPPLLAAVYLQALCSAEGYTWQRGELLQMYEDSVPKVDVIDNPDIPTPCTSDDHPPDLRRMINRLQFLCSSADSETVPTPGWEHAPDPGDDLCDWNSALEQRQEKNSPVSADGGHLVTSIRTDTPLSGSVLAARHADLVSYADSHLMRKPWDTHEAMSWSSCERSNDDEVGHSILFREMIPDSGFGMRSQDGEIYSALLHTSRTALKVGQPMRGPPPSSLSGRKLFRARVDYQREMAVALSDIVPLSTLAMRREVVYLDYASSIRDFVAAEDRDELRFRLVVQRTGRMTRNSGGTYVRMMPVTDEARAALSRTLLPI